MIVQFQFAVFVMHNGGAEWENKFGNHPDEFFNWDCHISHVKNKLSKSNYAINSTKNILPLHIRKLL